MDGHPSVKQQGFMRTPQIVQAQILEAQSVRYDAEPVGHVLWAPQLCKRELFTLRGRAGEYQSIGR
jgi:hypothetical protein